MIARLWLLFRFEWRKLLGRRLPLVVFFGVIVLALLAPKVGHVVDTASALAQGKVARQDPYAQGWSALCGSVKTTRLFLTLAVLVLAGSSVAEERSQGTLRALVLRPVRRAEIVGAKLLALWSYGAALLVAAVAAAAIGAELTQGLYDVVDPYYPDRLIHSFGDMWGYTYLAVGLSLPPLLALASMGILISSLFDHPGYATGVSVAALFFLSAAAGLSGFAREALFVGYLAAPFETVGDLAAQFTNVRKNLAPAAVLQAVVVPLAWALGCFVLTALVLSRRDVTD
jgi:ABC-type transport system involved in multi-copper enzyme maturation permease subunit